MRPRTALFSLSALAILSACGSGHNDAGPVSPEEDRMLNEAASSPDADHTALRDNGTTDGPSEKGNMQ